MGAFRGPHKILSVNQNNGITVDIDGTPQKFNVSQIVPTNELSDRNPPAYSDSLNQQTLASDQPVRVESQQSVASAASVAVSEDKELSHVETDAQTEEEEKSLQNNKASSKKFSIVLDRISNTRYAAELEQEENITTAKLYMRAKRGRYQPIWFDPNDPN